MGRFVVLVDAGYLLAQSVQILTRGATRQRSGLRITDPQGLVDRLVTYARDTLGNPDLLRVYWYDGVRDEPSPEQRALALLADCQLRPGTVNGQGQQKGVDSRIVADLIELATHRAMTDALLVTGDGDLAVGIALAQRHGVRVGLLGLEDLAAGIESCQSLELLGLADRVRRVDLAELGSCLQYIPPPAAVAGPGLATPDVAPELTPAERAGIAEAVLASLPEPPPAMVVGPTGSIDPGVDRALIAGALAVAQRALGTTEKHALRREFVALWNQRARRAPPP